jgi:hypothetical protein
MAGGSDSVAEHDSARGGLFAELERIKRVTLDCARTVLGTTGARLLHTIQHNLKEARRLKARLNHRIRFGRRIGSA